MLIVRGEHVRLPKVYKLWFCPGGGGNWLNYLIWVWRNKKIIPGNHLHFSVPILTAANSEYRLLLELLNHNDDPRKNSRPDVLLGSHRAWYNQWYMNIIKNQTKGDNLGHDFKSMNLKFNLDWADIVEAPERFLLNLNQITNEGIEFNSMIEQVWRQYLESSYPPGVQGSEYLDNPIFDIVLDNIYNTQTDTNASTRIRFQQAREIFDSHWIKCSPDSWAC